MGFLTAKISIQTKGSAQFDKQQTFALASALTLTGKEAQTAVRKALNKGQGGAFTIRNNWDAPSNVLGIRVKPATKQNLVTIVGTAADFLAKFMEKESGFVVKLPRGEFIAIPTTNVRRTKRDIIRAAQRPRALRGKRDILLPMRSGRGMVLFQERGRGKQLKRVALYILKPRVRIEEKDVLFGPTRRTFERRFPVNYHQQLQRAYATARK